jgi:hypothetical protein
VQFPPPPFFLNMRLQATVSVETRLTALTAKNLPLTRTGRQSAKTRHQAAVRVPGALPKALPGHHSMTRNWPLSLPLGVSCLGLFGEDRCHRKSHPRSRESLMAALRGVKPRGTGRSTSEQNISPVAVIT